ncbi:hypothetical protein Tco_0996705 [Tanacetum coccineum]
MAQDNGYVFVEVQEDGTKTICIDCWFEAQLGHGMSFATRPKPDREAMWVHCQMHHSRIGHTTTNRGLGVQSTTITGLAGGSVATGSITVPVVIDDSPSLLAPLRKLRMLRSCSLAMWLTEEVDKIRICKSCNGLLLCTGFG